MTVHQGEDNVYLGERYEEDEEGHSDNFSNQQK